MTKLDESELQIILNVLDLTNIKGAEAKVISDLQDKVKKMQTEVVPQNPVNKP